MAGGRVVLAGNKNRIARSRVKFSEKCTRHTVGLLQGELDRVLVSD